MTSINWNDRETYVEIIPPLEFSFHQCLDYLARDPNECLHAVEQASIWKLLTCRNENILLKIHLVENRLLVEFPCGAPSMAQRGQAAAYVWEWFDFDTDLRAFYALAQSDNLIKTPILKHYGLRLMGIPDLFEALTWAITGQQINLAFAYTLRKRFVTTWGESMAWDGRQFWLYPTTARVAALSVADLTSMQFTTRKAEYIIGIAQAIESGDLSLAGLKALSSPSQVREKLVALRGIGPWTADYTMMRCLRLSDAFPLEDVGLQNAVQRALGMDRKPSLDELRALAEPWRGFQAYATFYLWRTLY